MPENTYRWHNTKKRTNKQTKNDKGTSLIVNLFPFVKCNRNPLQLFFTFLWHCSYINNCLLWNEHPVLNWLNYSVWVLLLTEPIVGRTRLYIWRVELQKRLQTIWHVSHLQYSFSLVFRHKTYVRPRTNIILLYIMYISPIETLKFNNLV